MLYPNIDIEEQKISGFNFKAIYKIKTKGEKYEFSKKNIHILKKL